MKVRSINDALLHPFQHVMGRHSHGFRCPQRRQYDFCTRRSGRKHDRDTDHKTRRYVYKKETVRSHDCPPRSGRRASGYVRCVVVNFNPDSLSSPAHSASCAKIDSQSSCAAHITSRLNGVLPRGVENTPPKIQSSCIVPIESCKSSRSRGRFFGKVGLGSHRAVCTKRCQPLPQGYATRLRTFRSESRRQSS
jgi:hypothetical protein